MALRFSDSNIARRAAQLLVQAGFDSRKAGQLMDPKAKNPSAIGRKMSSSEEVQVEVSKILNRTERNAQKFLDMNWELFEKMHQKVTAGEEVPKEILEAGLNSNRILAKGYISEKGPRQESEKPALNIVASESELSNLTMPTDKPQ